MRTILVVEDSASSRELIREILEATGFQVVEASGGREALQRIKETKPDLILLDIQMPDLDGFAVVRRLRQDPDFATLPVVALTAYALPDEREKILQAGCNAHIAKPIDATTLKTEIDRLLG